VKLIARSSQLRFCPGRFCWQHHYSWLTKDICGLSSSCQIHRSDPRDTLALSTRNSSDSSSSQTTKCNLTSKGPTRQCMQPPTLALIVMRRTRRIIFASPDPSAKLGANVWNEDKTICQAQKCPFGAIVAKLGCGCRHVSSTKSATLFN
jgi:hypothetical protein